MKNLYLIDLHSLIFRAHYALFKANLVNSKGFDTAVTFGFLRMLTSIFKKFNPELIAVAYDLKAKTFRHEMFAEYKGTRKETPEPIISQTPIILEILEYMNIPTFAEKGFEADDLLGVISKRYEKKGYKVYIISGDRDLYQLISDNISIITVKKGISEIDIFDLKHFTEKYGITPLQFIDVKALQGDSSDNIPGVTGIGEKTALALIKEYGSLKNLYKNIQEMKKSKRKENLLNEKDVAFLSYDLAKIRWEENLEIKEIPDFSLENFKKEELFQKFDYLEFDSLIEEFNLTGESSFPIKEKIEVEYKTICDKENWNNYLEKIKKAEYICIDSETNSLDPKMAKIVGLSFCIESGKAVYLPLVEHRNPEKDMFFLGVESHKYLKLEEVIKDLKLILEDNTKKIIGHNLKFDIRVLLNNGIEIKNPYFDTMLASYILNPSSSQHNLDGCAKEYLNHKMISFKELLGDNKRRGSLKIEYINQVDLEKVAEYAAEDADMSYRLYELFKKLLKAKQVEKLFFELEMPMMQALVEMEENGIKLDLNLQKALKKDFSEKLELIEKEIFTECGKEFNLRSTQQLADVLFNDIGLNPVKKTKTGFSTDNEVLETLSEEHDLPFKILFHRHFSKLLSTYVESIPELICPKTGLIHTSFNQAVARTGRLSSSNPNLQNIPVKTEEGRKIRKLFIPRQADYIFLSADYSQIELRVLAHLSKDENLITAFLNNEDIHTKTAALIFDKDLDSVEKSDRNIGKIINFSVIYGKTAYQLAKDLRISRNQAQDFIDGYFSRYTKVLAFFDEVVEFGKENGYVYTLLGRKRYLPELKSKNKNILKNAGRVARNTPIQGTAADIIKLANINLHKEIKNNNFDCKLLLQVHDELLFEVKKDSVKELMILVKDKMENAINLRVPLIVDFKQGYSWADLKKV